MKCENDDNVLQNKSTVVKYEQYGNIQKNVHIFLRVYLTYICNPRGTTEMFREDFEKEVGLLLGLYT